jgi:purine-cytosine permease-like protein
MEVVIAAAGSVLALSVLVGIARRFAELRPQLKGIGCVSAIFFVLLSTYFLVRALFGSAGNEKWDYYVWPVAFALAFVSAVVAFVLLMLISPCAVGAHARRSASPLSPGPSAHALKVAAPLTS